MIVVKKNLPPEEVISLLQCLLELSSKPRHDQKYCETNKCPRCNYDVYWTQLEREPEPKCDKCGSPTPSSTDALKKAREVKP